MPDAKKNRRHAPRITEAGGSIEYVAPSPRVQDLSLNGAYVLDTRPFHIGESVEFRLWLGPRDSIVVQGMVRRVEAGRGMALEFIHIEGTDRRRLKDYLSRFESYGDIPPTDDF
jgi:hypothetical protein